MNRQRRYYFFLLVLIMIIPISDLSGQDQVNFKIHSHNDYEQIIPFWNAYGNGLNSIEVDVFLVDNELFVAHHKNEIKAKRTLESLYLLPLRSAIDLELGPQQPIQLLIDIKTDAVTTLEKLITILGAYPDLTGRSKLTFVISGNRPDPGNYMNYPDYIQFDYQSLENISDEAWKKVALISLPFQRFSKWKGAAPLPGADQKKISEVINKAHAFGKPFRFWGTPDTQLAWRTFVDSGIDFINTDDPYECSTYLMNQN